MREPEVAMRPIARIFRFRGTSVGCTRGCILASMGILAIEGGCVGQSSHGCPEGEVRVDGYCESYEPGDPVEGDGVWQPVVGCTWQCQQNGEVDTSYDVEMYDVDLFEVTDTELSALSDRVVICRFSAGTYEPDRPDSHLFPREALGGPLDDSSEELWLDITNSMVRTIMIARLNLARDRGCDGVEPDNMDGFASVNGVHLNATEQMEYNRFIADEAHARGLSVGLKNDVEQVVDLVDWFDWAMNEQCHLDDECPAYDTFTGAGMAVFHLEYVDQWPDATTLASEICDLYPDLSTLIKTRDLGPEFLACS